MTQVHSLELEVVDSPDVLARVVAVCHQLGSRIVALHYERADQPICLVLRVDADSPHVQRLMLKLSNIVHVVGIRICGLIR